MEKNKTAMQELIEELNTASKAGINDFITTTINLIIDMAENKLEKEKQQIQDAYYTGAFNFSEHSTKAIRWSKEYYKETYGEQSKQS